jgi:hypothetical protein
MAKKQLNPLGLTRKEAKALMADVVWKHFGKWFTGQTGPVITDEEGKAECGFYTHDVERYLDMILKKKPTYFD